ncbi:FecR family protein [Dyadobacter psychrotolerans]|uniref:FecR family protein n=1 Tax=Dyadobacter psychrotolerans TaxID=2541721 RepID=A0A4R5DXG0_9BACT|nr:FecR family protein [Dyadobacter psychrotolerans]TDE17140.1 FecR family protein [Dyadobacter psychrotolerans]
MENYSNYKTEDFLHDERFRKWILSGGEEESLFWENFKLQFPEKNKELILARALLTSLSQLQLPAEKEVKQKIWTRVESSIDKTFPESEAHYIRRPFYRWWMAAAILLIAGGLAWIFRSTFKGVPLEYKTQVVAAKMPLREKINVSQAGQTISLADGSTVKLKPGSKLSYSDFSANKRVVYLDGEGYFDVAKNSAKPFIVYAGRIVVQVVGTSFSVVSNTGKAISNVSVTSGKVKVFATDKFEESAEQKAEQMIYLLPNQRVVYDARTSIFKKGLVEQPVQLAGTGDPKEFYFDNTSVKDILGELETAYGVNIDYNNASLKTCKVTAPLGDLPLFRKLDIICQTVGATYEVFGTEIVISGGACDL